MSHYQKFVLKNIDVKTGFKDFLMTPLELKDFIDFEPKRLYFISNIKSRTGAHCHKIEKEFFIMIQGSCIAVLDFGQGLTEVKLNGPSEAIYVGNYVWHSFKEFSHDAILLALSSTNYNSNREDYIEDYEEYIKIRDKFLV